MERTEQERIRHIRYMEKLKASMNTKELPKKVTSSVLLNSLVNLVSFKDHKIEKEKLEVFIEPLFGGANTSYFTSIGFIRKMKEILKEEYKDKTDEELNLKIYTLIKNQRIINLLDEINSYSIIYEELYKKEIKEKHENTLIKIKSTRNIDELPKVGISKLNAQIRKDLYELFNNESLTVEYTGPISNLLLQGKRIYDPEVIDAIRYICNSKDMNQSIVDKSGYSKEKLVSTILEEDKIIKYLVEEIKVKEGRIKQIYKLDHNDIMEQIKDSRRISQMPPGLSISRITNYLSANSMVYPKGSTIKGGEFIGIAESLLNGEDFSDISIKMNLKQIVDKYYPNDIDYAYKVMYNKLSTLPKINYYVEEVRYGIEKQKEFISRGTSNVNVYFIPNPKSPIDGGRFYNCYINRASNLNLDEVLPLDLEEIIPPNTDIDGIEWYVQEHADPTFKMAGGIILNRDESIGGVNIFKPNDGKVGITKEEKTKYEKLEELSKKLKQVTDISKKAKEEYLKQQAIIDEQISTIQEAMNILIDDKGKGLK